MFGNHEDMMNDTGRKRIRIAVLALCCSLLGGAIGAGGTAIGMQMASGTEGQEQKAIVSEQQAPAELYSARIGSGVELSASEVYAANVNSTVGITTSITTNYFGYPTTAAASGSGFVLTEDGYIVTNYHVVEGANSIRVTTYDGSTYEAAMVGYDESNDIAVLKVEASGLTPVKLGDSNALSVGENVVAIGNPLGELTFSLTSGVVSALNREITMSNGATMNLIQTDCAINSGNSGGALFNMYGEVIGITNAKYSANGSSGEASIDNIGFAIPISDVKAIIDSIIEKGYVSKPYIGITVEDGAMQWQSGGAVVASVKAGSPAEQAGLQVQDVIIQADDTPITSSSELVQYIGKREIGETVTLTVNRQGETLELTITVGERNDQESNQENYGFPWGNGYMNRG